VAMEMGIESYTEFMVGLNTGDAAKITDLASDSIMRRAFVGNQLVMYVRSIQSIDQFDGIARIMSGETNIIGRRVQ
jgi:hypothetical protein